MIASVADDIKIGLQIVSALTLFGGVVWGVAKLRTEAALNRAALTKLDSALNKLGDAVGDLRTDLSKLHTRVAVVETRQESAISALKRGLPDET